MDCGPVRMLSLQAETVSDSVTHTVYAIIMHNVDYTLLKSM